MDIDAILSRLSEDSSDPVRAYFRAHIAPKLTAAPRPAYTARHANQASHFTGMVGEFATYTNVQF